MMRYKRRKFSRQRGSSGHGWGAKKKHRGAGHRGGRGNAGSGKRADQKKPSIWDTDYFGKHGFASKSRTDVRAISILALQDSLQSMVKDGMAKHIDGFYVLDLGALGFDKLLSKGRVTKKFKIKVKVATEKAAAKIKAAGGVIE